MMNEWIISSSVLIAAVLLGRRLLRGKISLRLQYALWAVVLLRLLLPVQIFTSNFGTGSIAKEVDMAQPVQQFYISANEDRYEREYDEAYRQVVARYEAASHHYDPIVIEQEAAQLAQTNLKLDLAQLLFHLWFAGMVVMTSVIAACNVHLSIQLKRRRQAMEVPDSLLPVYVTEVVPTPCIFGIFKPAVYLTPDAAEDPQVRAHVLAHELTHYRHWDHVWSVLRSLCLVLHWYNPLVWAAAKVSRADAELACDEGALVRLGEEARGDYGRTLIGLTCSAPISDLLLTATTMTGSANSIRERIRLLMQRPRNTVLTLTAVVLMVTLIVGCTFSGAPETTQPGIDLEGEKIENSDIVIFDFPDTPEPTGHTPDNDMSYHGEDLPIPDDLPQTDEVRALFAEGGDPWYLAALVAPYADYQSFDAETFFSAGQTSVALTDAEKALITETYGKEALEHTIFRMTEQRMDQVLDQYAGTMVWNVDLSEFVFCNETGAYLLVKDEVPELRRPEIISCEQLAENQVRMVYRFPGEEQTYCATLLKGENWKVYSNHLLLDKPLDARPLTEEEVAAVRLAFSPSYDDAPEDGSDNNPRAAFLLDMYSDISEMSRSKFLTYYPATEKCEDEEEFQLLKQKYPEDFETEQTIRDMNWPIHRIPASEVKAVMAEYTLAEWDDLPYDGWYHYLEETDCYYTYYSDVGLFGFHCIGGWVYEGGAMLYNDFASPASVLILTEQNGQYYIQAHLPALIMG